MSARPSAYLIGLALVLPGCASRQPPMRPPAPAPVLPEVPRDEQVSLSGVITSSRDGRKLAGMLVILECACLAGAYESHTNAEGQYSYRGLPPGSYMVRVRGATAEIHKIMDIRPGAKFRANFLFDPTRAPLFWEHRPRPDWKFVDRGLLYDDRCENWPGLCQR